MQKKRNLGRVLAAIFVCMLLLSACLAVSAAANTVDTEIMPGTTIPGGTNDPSAPQPRAADPDPMPSVGDGGLSGGAWGVLIAVGVAALSVVLIFLIMPKSKADHDRERERKQR
jgi:hypothetical protein